ncbi:BrnT family toxin [soil metagenome]
MRFDWDIRKDQSNQRKHGIEFSVAEHVFNDPFAKRVEDREVKGEVRWLMIGCTPAGSLLSVAHTFHETGGEEEVRIISARKATPHERRLIETASET